MAGDRPLLGIVLMLGFCILAPMGDGLAKFLAPMTGVLQLVLIRFAAQSVLIIAVFGKPLPSQRVLSLIVLRTGFHMSGLFFIFTALTVMPLADAIAIAFVMPFIMLLLGHYILGEEVGPRRMIACGIGFVGTLCVVQPAFAEIGWVATLPLIVAVAFALFMMATRMIAKDIDPIPLQGWSGMIASGCLCVIFISPIGPDLRPLDSDLIWLAVAAGVLGTLSHLAMTWSLRLAPASTLAPMQYLEIPFAAFVGWVAFKDVPGPLAAFGICLTMGAGIYIILRTGRPQAASPP